MERYKRKFKEGQYPSEIEIGKKYQTDKGNIVILDIIVDYFNSNYMEAYVTFKWETSEGKTGKARVSASALKKNYF